MKSSVLQIIRRCGDRMCLQRQGSTLGYRERRENSTGSSRKQRIYSNISESIHHPPYDALTPLCALEKPSRVRGVSGGWRYGSRHSLPRQYMRASSHPHAPPRNLHPPGRYPINKRPGGSYSHSTCFGKQIKLLPLQGLEFQADG